MINSRLSESFAVGDTWTGAGAKLINSSRIEDRWIAYAGVVLQTRA